MPFSNEAQGEIDVVGISLKDKKVYVCEVAIHWTTGLQYVKAKRPNNINKLTEKFSRDIEYANKYFANYDKHFMLWSPIVKGRKDDSQYDQLVHLNAIDANIKGSYGVSIEFVVNERFLACINEMRAYAKTKTEDLKYPVMRLLQIEEHLSKHIGRLR